jgi:hypothetical protein
MGLLYMLRGNGMVFFPITAEEVTCCYCSASNSTGQKLEDELQVSNPHGSSGLPI